MSDANGLEVKIATSPALLARGCVNVIGLETFKANAGERWERLRETVYARTEALLGQKLGPADFFVRLNETAYLVTMPSSSAEEAQICCLRVAHELHASLLGPCTIADVDLHRALPGANDGFELQKIVEPEISMMAVRAGLNDLVHGTAGVTFAAGMPASHAAGPQGFSHNFLPIWDARAEAITASRILTRRNAALPTGASASELFKSELARSLCSIAGAVEALGRNLGAGKRFLMIVPLSYEVLSSPIGRMEIASACRNLSSELRPFLIFEISNVPAGVPNSRLNDLATIVKPFCKAIMAQIPLRARNYAAYQGVGLNAIGIILPQAEMPIAEAREEIARLCDAVKKIGLLAFVGNVSGADQVRFSREAGAHLLAGKAIALPAKEPSAMRRLPLSNILQAGAHASQ